jgi:hypothetical protein
LRYLRRSHGELEGTQSDLCVRLLPGKMFPFLGQQA